MNSADHEHVILTYNSEPCYMGIDASLTGTGIAVVDKKGELLHRERISSKKTGVARLREIRDKVILSAWEYNPAVIGYEGYSFGSKNKREAMGELGGVLKTALTEQGFRVLVIQPTSVKKFATGSGAAKKDHILLEVFKKYGVEFKTNDEADAFVLAMMARAKDQQIAGLKYEIEALKKVEEVG